LDLGEAVGKMEKMETASRGSGILVANEQQRKVLTSPELAVVALVRCTGER
jgi:hypothetical protein